MNVSQMKNLPGLGASGSHSGRAIVSAIVGASVSAIVSAIVS